MPAIRIRKRRRGISLSTRRRKRFKRRSYRKYKRYSGWTRALGAFPQRKTVAIRYVQDLTLDAGNNSSAVNVFRVNSVYDPDYTGTGHQPMFHDVYSNIYEKYHVNYATIRMVALSTHIVNTTTPELAAGTNTGANQFYAVNERACRMWILRDSGVSDYPSNLDTLIEEGSTNFRWKYCPQTTNGRLPSVKMMCSPHKQLGLSKRDDTLNAIVTNNPGAEAYFICGVEGLGGSYNPDSMQFQVIITYNVTYYELKKNQTQN